MGWLERLLGLGAGIGSAIRGFVGTVISGLVTVLDHVFGDVGREWTRLEHEARDLAESLIRHASGVYSWLHRLVTYDIPHFAHTAWWWVTHPASLTEILGWHLVRWLEDHAWQAGKWLGGFMTSLVLRNPRRVAQLVETILAAVL